MPYKKLRGAVPISKQLEGRFPSLTTLLVVVFQLTLMIGRSFLYKYSKSD